MRNSKPIAWDMMYVQIIVLLIVIAVLIAGAAYFVPSQTAGQAFTSDNSYYPGGDSRINKIECNDSIDNDNNGLADLDDGKCRSRWDVSERY